MLESKLWSHKKLTLVQIWLSFEWQFSFSIQHNRYATFFSLYILWYVPLKNNISHCVIFQINEQGFSGLLSEFCKSALRLFDYAFHVIYFYVLVTLQTISKTWNRVTLTVNISWQTGISERTDGRTSRLKWVNGRRSLCGSRLTFGLIVGSVVHMWSQEEFKSILGYWIWKL